MGRQTGHGWFAVSGGDPPTLASATTDPPRLARRRLDHDAPPQEPLGMLLSNSLPRRRAAPIDRSGDRIVALWSV
ncbi:MAG TPA: hypothetical protein VF119_03560, partial [Candidatus Limnocylindrales bacterium]